MTKPTGHKVGDECPHCKEAKLDDWFLKTGRCGWCGTDVETSEPSILVPASSKEGFAI